MDCRTWGKSAAEAWPELRAAAAAVRAVGARTAAAALSGEGERNGERRRFLRSEGGKKKGAALPSSSGSRNGTAPGGHRAAGRRARGRDGGRPGSSLGTAAVENGCGLSVLAAPGGEGVPPGCLSAPGRGPAALGRAPRWLFRGSAPEAWL